MKLLDRLRALFGRGGKAGRALPPLPEPRAKVTYVKERRVSRVKLDPKALRRRKIFRYIAAALAILVSIGSIVIVKATDRGTTLPDEVLGVWQTDEPRYAGRRIELVHGAVAFQTAGDQGALPWQPITQVRRGEHELGTMFAVEYMGRDGELAYFHFIYSHDGARRIYLANQTDFAWYRTGDAVQTGPFLGTPR